MTRPDLLAGCDADQAEAIRTTDQPLCVIAGAGSGKTRVLTRRIAWRVLEGTALASHVLTLTFTRKAASELRGRLGSLGLPEPVTAGTFHAIALAELRRLAAERGQAPPVVLASKARLLHAVVASFARPLGPTGGRQQQKQSAKASAAPVHDLAAEIEWAKSRLVDPADYAFEAHAAGRVPLWPRDDVARVYDAYERERRRRRVLDFEDLLRVCAAETEADPGFAASARWRFRHLFVDEYQDINDAQLRLLKAWAGPSTDVCAVGDPDQAIYSWNGSNPEAIRRFPLDFPGSRVIELRTNYRSTAEVLRVAGAVLGRPDVAPAGGPAPEGPVPTVVAYPDDAAEAAGVADRARLAHRPGRRWSQIAVLARTNAQLPGFAAALEARGVPARIAGTGSFARRPHVAAALEDLGRAVHRSALVALAADLLADSAAAAVDAKAEADGRGSIGGDGRGGDPEDLAELSDLAELARLAEEYLTQDETATGSGFRSWIETAARGDEATTRSDAVELTTFHRAKGLEWPVVFVTGLEDGLVPISHAKDPVAQAEERRLLYVACTRASEELSCTWAEARRFSGDRPSAREPSPYLPAIERARRQLSESRKYAPDVAREALAASRRALEE